MDMMERLRALVHQLLESDRGETSSTGTGILAGGPKLFPHVKRAHEPILDPPYILGKAGSFESHGFCIDAKPSALTALCDRELNEPLKLLNEKTRFRPIFLMNGGVPLGQVVVTVNAYGSTSAGPLGDPPQELEDALEKKKVSIPYSEVCFMFFVEKIPDEHDGTPHTGAVPRETFLFLPVVYIGPLGDRQILEDSEEKVLDAAIYPIVFGREIYGFSKGPGKIIYDRESYGWLNEAKLAVLDLSPGEELEFDEILKITLQGPPPSAPPGTPPAEFKPNLKAFLSQLLVGASLLPIEWSEPPPLSSEGHGQLVGKLPDGRVFRFDTGIAFGAPLLTLKQFRDPIPDDNGNGQACYQAVVATPLILHGKQMDHLKSDYLLEFKNPSSLPIWPNVGIGSGPVLMPSNGGCFYMSGCLEFGDPKLTRVWRG